MRLGIQCSFSKMASDAEVVSFLESFVQSEEINQQKAIVEKITNLIFQRKSSGVLQVVEALGTYLTNKDVLFRRKGTQFLAELMHRLDTNQLNPQEIDVMTLFFCDRLKDHHSIQPQVIYGLLGMVSYHNLPDNLIIKICQTIFSEVHVQSLTQADRRNVFNLYSNLLDKNIRALRRLGPDFVLGFIQGMDGEKDPRNLIVCFKNVEKVVQELQFDAFTEDLFEVTSCYFPIDFTPPANDPLGVRKEDLILKLRACLSSTREFAEFCVPLLLEKLSSDIVDAKIDSLLTIAACARTYLPEDMKEYSEDVWNAIRKDYLLGGIKALESSCLVAIESIIKCLEPEPETCSQFIHVILRDCEHSLKDPDLALPQQLGCILQSVLYSTTDAFQMSITRVMRVITALLHEQHTETKLIHIIKILYNILQKPLSDNKFKIHSLVQPFIEELSSFLLSTMSSNQNSSLVSICISSLIAMARHHLLPPNEVTIVMQFLVKELSTTDNYTIYEVCLESCETLCKNNLETEKGYISKTLQEKISVLSSRGFCSQEQLNIIKNMLHTLSKSFSSTDELKLIVHYLLEQLSPLKDSPQIFMAVLTTIEEVVSDHNELSEDLERLISPCFYQYILHGLGNTVEEMLSKMTSTLRILISRLPLPLQSERAKQIISFCVSGDATLLTSNLQAGDVELDSNIFTIKQSNMSNLVILSMMNAILSGLNANIALPDVGALLKWLHDAIVNSDDITTAQYGCKTFASIINKMAEGAELDAAIQGTVNLIDGCISSNDCQATGSKKQETSALLFLWLSKALVLRWHKSVQNIVNKLISYIHIKPFGKHLAEYFAIIVQDFDDCLNAKMHARMKLMYKQRFLEFAMPKLVEEYTKAAEDAKGNFLKAISHLLQQLPKQILQKQISELIPLLIRSLSFADNDVLSSTLNTITSLDTPVVLKDHVTSLIPRLLSLCRAETMVVRQSAIKCLSSLCSLPPHTIYPYQRKVIKTLKACVGDKKRLVRKEACKCRNDWYLLRGDA